MRNRVLNCMLQISVPCTEQEYENIDNAVYISYIFVISCGIITCVNIGVFYKQTMILKQ